MFIGVLFWLSQLTSQVVDIDALEAYINKKQYEDSLDGDGQEMAKHFAANIPSDLMIPTLLNLKSVKTNSGTRLLIGKALSHLTDDPVIRRDLLVALNNDPNFEASDDHIHFSYALSTQMDKPEVKASVLEKLKI